MAAISEHNEYIRNQPQPIICPITHMSVIPSNPSDPPNNIPTNFTPNIIIPSNTIIPIISYPSRNNIHHIINPSLAHNNNSSSTNNNEAEVSQHQQSKKKYLMTQFFSTRGEILPNRTNPLTSPDPQVVVTINSSAINSNVIHLESNIPSTIIPIIESIIPIIGLPNDILHQTQREKEIINAKSFY